MRAYENLNYEHDQKIRITLTKGEQMMYDACFGKCNICFNEGACNLQQKLKEIEERQ